MPRYEIRDTSDSSLSYVEDTLPLNLMLHVPAGTYRPKVMSAEEATDIVVPALDAGTISPANPGAGDVDFSLTGGNVPAGATYSWEVNDLPVSADAAPTLTVEDSDTVDCTVTAGPQSDSAPQVTVEATSVTGTVGAAATTDGTPAFAVPDPTGGTPPTSLTIAGIYSRSVHDSNRTFVEWGNVSIVDRQGSLRMNASDGTDGATPTQSYSGSVGDRIGFIVTIAPDGGTGSNLTIGTFDLDVNPEWNGAETTNVPNMSPIDVSATLTLFGGAMAGDFYRLVVAVGVAPDISQAAVYNALVDVSGGAPVIVSDPTTFHTALGKQPEVDLYGGAADFNNELNNGGTVDLTGTGTGTWT